MSEMGNDFEKKYLWSEEREEEGHKFKGLTIRSEIDGWGTWLLVECPCGTVMETHCLDAYLDDFFEWFLTHEAPTANEVN